MKVIIEPISYKLYDININIKCRLKVGVQIYIFNCHTKHEDSAEEEIQKLLFICLTTNKTFKTVLKEEGNTTYEEVGQWNY